MKGMKGMGSLGTVGLEIAVAILFGLLGGHWLDNKFHTAPYLAIAGFGLGLVTACRAVYRAWKDMQRETEREEREQGNPAPMLDPPLDKEPSDDRRSPPPLREGLYPGGLGGVGARGAPDPPSLEDTDDPRERPTRPSNHSESSDEP